jgi:hypothetical protein
MNVAAVIASLSTTRAPGKEAFDISGMNAQEIEQAILDIVGALRHFDTLLELLESVNFEVGDRKKVGHAAAMVTERIEWALSVLMHLKPAN